MNVTSLGLADVDAAISTAKVGGVSLGLAVADLTSTNLDKLKAIVDAGKLTSITLTDKAAQTLSLSADNFGKYAGTLGKIANGALLKIALTSNSLSAENMSGISAAMAAKLSATTKLTVTGTSNDFVSNIGSLTALAAASKIASVTVSSGPEMTLSAASYKANAAAIALLKGSQKTVTFSSARTNYRNTVNTNGSLTVLDLRAGSPDGSVTLTGVNYAKFSDMAVFGTSGNGNIDTLLNIGANAWWYNGGGAASSSSAVSDTISALSSDSSKHNLKFSFLTALPSAASAKDKLGFQAMTDTQKNAVKNALDYISSLVDISFTLATGSEVADISFGTNNQGATSAGYANPPHGNGAIPTSYLFLNNVDPTNTKSDSFNPGNYGWTTLIHEIGHTLGLKHPGNYNAGGGGGVAPFLPTAIDTRKLSIMSYNDPANLAFTYQGGTKPTLAFKSVYDTSFMTYDLAALQFMYGKKTDGVSDAQASIQLTTQTTQFASNYRGFETIWAPGGAALDASLTTSNNVFDLRAGAYSSIGDSEQAAFIKDLKSSGKSDAEATTFATATIKAQVASTKARLYSSLNNTGLAYGSTIASVKGGSGNDKFYASSYESSLDGGDGAADTVFLQGSASQWKYEGADAPHRLRLPVGTRCHAHQHGFEYQAHPQEHREIPIL